MRFSAYITLMVVLAIVLSLCGFGPLYRIDPNVIMKVNCDQLTKQNDLSADTLAKCIGDSNGILFWLIAALGIGALIGFVTGFSAIYIIPALFIIGLLTLFAFPLGFLNSTIVPEVIKAPLVLIFALFQIIATFDFIRGGA